MFRPFLISFVLALSIARGDSDVKSKKGSFRFLSISDDLPIKYAQSSDGREMPVFAGSDEEPPSTVFIKQGDTYSPLALPRNNVGKPIPTKMTPGEKETQGYFLKASASESMSESWIRNMGDPAKGGKKPLTGPASPVKYLLLAKPVPADKKDYLLCLFQPSCKDKWYPPKNLVIDISPDVFPAGSLMLLNFSDRSAFIKIGTESPAVKLDAGKIRHVSSLNDPRNIPLAVGAENRAGTALEMVFNRPKSLPENSRGLVVVYSLYEKNSPKAVGVKFIPVHPEASEGGPLSNRTDTGVKKTH